MAPVFAKHDVALAAISKDTPEEAAKHKRDDELTMTLLSDPSFQVIRQFGLLHRKALQFDVLFPNVLPLGRPVGFKDMALPTTLLIDAEGRIRWIDQSTDYRMRSDEEMLERALAEHLLQGSESKV